MGARKSVCVLYLLTGEIGLLGNELGKLVIS